VSNLDKAYAAAFNQNKYPDHFTADQIAAHIEAHYACPEFQDPVLLEMFGSKPYVPSDDLQRRMAGK
jgi:hypothetical protein